MGGWLAGFWLFWHQLRLSLYMQSIYSGFYSLAHWLIGWLSLSFSLSPLSPFSVSVCLCFCLYLSVSLILTNTYTNTDTHLLFPLLLFINSLTHSLTSLTTSLQPAKHPEKYVSPSPPQTGVKNFRLVAHAQWVLHWATTVNLQHIQDRNARIRVALLSAGQCMRAQWHLEANIASAYKLVRTQLKCDLRVLSALEVPFIVL